MTNERKKKEKEAREQKEKEEQARMGCVPKHVYSIRLGYGLVQVKIPGTRGYSQYSAFGTL